MYFLLILVSFCFDCFLFFSQNLFLLGSKLRYNAIYMWSLVLNQHNIQYIMCSLIFHTVDVCGFTFAHVCSNVFSHLFLLCYSVWIKNIEEWGENYVCRKSLGKEFVFTRKSCVNLLFKNVEKKILMSIL